MSYLVDTNVVSELRKRSRADAGVVDFFATVDPDDLYLSVLTLGELRKGVERIRRRDPEAAHALDAWLADVLRAYESRILGIDHRIAEVWGEMNAGDPLPVVDSLLAATAKVHRLTLVTRNVRDFERSGVSILDPFTG